MSTLKEVVQALVIAFNKGDAEAIGEFYDEEAINHSDVPTRIRKGRNGLYGRESIRRWRVGDT